MYLSFFSVVKWKICHFHSYNCRISLLYTGILTELPFFLEIIMPLSLHLRASDTAWGCCYVQLKESLKNSSFNKAKDIQDLEDLHFVACLVWLEMSCKSCTSWHPCNFKQGHLRLDTPALPTVILSRLQHPQASISSASSTTAAASAAQTLQQHKCLSEYCNNLAKVFSENSLQSTKFLELFPFI